jgi:putative ABC transport system permease protein
MFADIAQHRITRNIRLGIKNLDLHKTRSLLTTLGVVFGVASVIAMLSVGEGASRQALEQIRKLGSNLIILSSVKPAADEQGGVQQNSRMLIYGLLYDDQLRIAECVPHASTIVPVRLIRNEARLKGRAIDLRVVATGAEWFDIVKREMLAGRRLNSADIERNARVCVLTEHGARKLLATEHTLGVDISLGDRNLEVVGIVQSETGGSAVQLPDQEIDIYIPITTAIESYGEVIAERTSGSHNIELVQLHRLLVEIDHIGNVERSAQAIEAMLARFHERKDYDMSVPLTLLRQAEATKRTFNIVLGSIAGISLLVGGIGIMNIMLASVTERTREIGVRRAVGAKRSQIIGQFIIETVVLSGAGGVIGTLLGVAIPWLITALTGMPTVVSPLSIVLALSISMTVGIVFGLYPAARAARLDPIEALRHE